MLAPVGSDVAAEGERPVEENSLAAPEWHRRVMGWIFGQLAAHRGKTARAWTTTGACRWLPRPPKAPGSVALLTCIGNRTAFTSIGFGNVRGPIRASIEDVMPL